MKLLCSLTSPYARKVRVLALERGFDLKLVVVDPHRDDPALIAASPPGKVPVLELDDGSHLYDSRVICAHLDAASGRSPLGVADLSREALTEAILDAAVVMVMESRRPEALRSRDVVERQSERIGRILDALQAAPPPSFEAGTPSRVQLGAAVSLAYLDFRLSHLDWRAGRTGLADWFETAERRPSMIETRPPE